MPSHASSFSYLTKSPAVERGAPLPNSSGPRVFCAGRPRRVSLQQAAPVDCLFHRGRLPCRRFRDRTRRRFSAPGSQDPADHGSAVDYAVAQRVRADVFGVCVPRARALPLRRRRYAQEERLCALREQRWCECIHLPVACRGLRNAPRWLYGRMLAGLRVRVACFGPAPDESCFDDSRRCTTRSN
jgi:hypothetical protein